ncbi:hypothetical protein U1Q18_022412 [Sarracenia purpurea var. burkii]
MATVVCDNPLKINSEGIFLQNNPLKFSFPLLLFQVSLITITSNLIDLCLHPLGISTIVSKICGGIIFGPSVLGNGNPIASALFPPKGVMVLETFAVFGLMFFFFQIGVKMDSGLMLRPTRIDMAIAVSITLSSLGLTTVLTILLKTYVPMNESLAKSLPVIAVSQCMSPFTNVVTLLTELKILNADLSRIACTTSMFCDVFSITLMTVGFAALRSPNMLISIFAIVVTVTILGAIVYAFRTTVMWIHKHILKGNPLREVHITTIFTAVLVGCLASEALGQHFLLGPLMLGLAVPEGPPLGAALAARLDSLISGLLYPTYLTVSGLKTDIFKIHLRSMGIILFVIVFASLVKIGTIQLMAQYKNLSSREAFVLGLMLNVKGICELVVYNLWKDSEFLTDEQFALAVMSVMATTVIISPLIKALYIPTIHRFAIKRRTVQQVKPGSELRVLVCIQNQNDIPTIVNLLEASCATKENPIVVIALLLVELVGRAAPMLIAHQPNKALDKNVSNAESHIINALRQYEYYNEGCVTVRSFSAISYLGSIHEDICRVAFDHNAAIVIVPFHKRWAIDGSIESANRPIQNVNIKVLDRAPCSVGILVDRGILNASLSIVNSQSVYHVAVLYIGGPDDMESLVYGARMANHSNVTLTLIRYLLFGSDSARERKLDSDLISEIRHANMGNKGFVYQEDVVRDGERLAACLRKLDKSFDLIIVGREHQDSSMLQGLGIWSECPELGVIGDFLASLDFASATSVLVVQQQRVARGRLISPVVNPDVNDKDIPIQSVQSHGGAATANSTW